MYLRCPASYFRPDGTAQCPVSAAEKAGYTETGFYVSYYIYSVGDQTYSGVLLQNYHEDVSNVVDSGSASFILFCSLIIWGFVLRFFSGS